MPGHQHSWYSALLMYYYYYFIAYRYFNYFYMSLVLCHSTVNGIHDLYMLLNVYGPIQKCGFSLSPRVT